MPGFFFGWEATAIDVKYCGPMTPGFDQVMNGVAPQRLFILPLLRLSIAPL